MRCTLGRITRMGWVLALVGGVGCGGDKDDASDGPPTDGDADTDADADADADADVDADTDADPTASTGHTGTTADWCEADPQVTGFTVLEGPIATSIQLDVQLDQPAPVVARCVMDSDPAQVFFVESTDTLTDHTLQLTGAIANETYTCTAAPDCALRTGKPAVASHFVDTPPGDLRRLDVEINPALGMTGSWTMGTYQLSNFQGPAYIVVWDGEGRVRWWHQLPDGVILDYEALYDVDRDEIVWGGGESPEGRVRVVNLWNETLYEWAPVGWQDVRFHHDAKRLDDGRLITLEVRENSGGGNTWDGFGIRVHDETTGVVDLDLDSQRYVDDGTLRLAGVGFLDNDPYHANWMDLKDDGAGGTTLYLSLCFDHTILAVDGVTGDVKWHFGEDKGWTLVDAAGASVPDVAIPQCQHGIDVLGPNHLLVYDNGQDRSYSSGQEWLLDPTTMTATLLWSWTEPGFKEDFLGDIDILDGDRVFLTMATLFGRAEFVEVDRATDTVASRMELTGGYTYRAQRYLGCDLFGDVTQCDETADRHTQVADILTP